MASIEFMYRSGARAASVASLLRFSLRCSRCFVWEGRMESTSQEVEFIPLEDAAAMTEATRITFIPGMQAIYAEALKNICFVKKIPIIRALHPMLGIDKATGEDRQAKLYELTRQTSLPTMFHNDERPRNVWSEQLALAEAIGAPDSAKLVPDDFAHRVDMFGLCAIVLGEDGLVWNMRILSDGPLGRKYGYSEAASKKAPGKMGDIIRLIDARLAEHGKTGVAISCRRRIERGRCLLGHRQHDGHPRSAGHHAAHQTKCRHAGHVRGAGRHAGGQTGGNGTA